MTWLEREAKIVAAASFIACQIEQEAGLEPQRPLSVRVYGCMLQLTCSCGAACTLLFKEETTAALWALLCLTEQTDGVLGAIQLASLTGWRANYWPNTEATPDRGDTVRRMRKAARLGNPPGRNSPRKGIRGQLSGEPPEELPPINF